MNTDIRRKMDTVIRVLAYCEAHPDDSAGYNNTLTRIRNGIRRAEALAAQQRTGVLDVTAATSRKKKLRNDIQHHLLVPLARVGNSAATEAPELEGKFQPPLLKTNHQRWRTGARLMQAEAEAHKDLFIRHGMSEALLADLTVALDQYDAAVNQTNAGRRAHVGARADLDAVMEENMLQVQLMDGLNLYRFKDDPENQAAWESAKNVPWPNNSRPETPPASGGLEPAGSTIGDSR